MTDVIPDSQLVRAMRLMARIPSPVLERMEEFAETQKTGQLTLNYLKGLILTADVREHIQPIPKNVVDNAKPND